MLTLEGADPPIEAFVEACVMPRLRGMHKKTAQSPRSTAKLFLLFEELTYRHLCRVDAAHFGNFRITSPAGMLEREDDYASNGLRGLADFVKALLKVIEAQARGFAHGHGKVHSSPDGLESLEKCLENIVWEILALEQSDGAAQPEEEVVERMVEQETASYNNRLMASASTRQYESARLPARQLGHDVLPEPFGAKQRRHSRYDGEMEADGKTQRENIDVVSPEPLAYIRRADAEAAHNVYSEIPLTGCQLCTSPQYLLPHSFGMQCCLGDEGNCVGGQPQLPWLPWEFDGRTGELLRFIASSDGDTAMTADFDRDAKMFEECFARDVRFLFCHNQEHECTGSRVKNQKKKTLEQLAKQLRSNRAPSCRFHFHHIVLLLVEEKLTKIRRRGN